jgi:exodeoxyribonuclease VII small subunit
MSTENSEPTTTYEQAREELADVVRRLEAGGLTLEESLALWERGEELAKLCQHWLDRARERLAAAAPADDAGRARPGGVASGCVGHFSVGGDHEARVREQGEHPVGPEAQQAGDLHVRETVVVGFGCERVTRPVVEATREHVAHLGRHEGPGADRGPARRHPGHHPAGTRTAAGGWPVVAAGAENTRGHGGSWWCASDSRDWWGGKSPVTERQPTRDAPGRYQVVI